MTNSSVVITGASSGIGEAIAIAFAKKGAKVSILDIQAPNAALSKAADYYHCDVTEHDKVHALIKEIADKQGIDVLVCNAGAHMSANIENTSEESLKRLFDLNVKGAFSATQAALPYMKARGGSIIYIASDQSIIAKANSFAYNLSKHALASMAKTTALDYAQFNIRANALCPGTIDTPLYQNAISSYCERSGARPSDVHKEEAAAQPLNRIGRAEEVAAFACFLASDEASFITGSLQAMDGGYTAQ